MLLEFMVMEIGLFLIKKSSHPTVDCFEVSELAINKRSTGTFGMVCNRFLRNNGTHKRTNERLEKEKHGNLSCDGKEEDNEEYCFATPR